MFRQSHRLRRHRAAASRHAPRVPGAAGGTDLRSLAFAIAAGAALCGWLAAASAQESLPFPGGGAAPSEEPVVLTADEVVYDETLELVIARGNVEISQEGRILRADQVTYNRRTRIVTATGNVVLVQPSGEVLFAEYAELEDDLRDGFIREVGVLLTDDSRIAANAGLRRDGQVTEVERAVYSPCDLCPDDPDRAPLWQVRATRVIHDTESHDVVYRDAVLDMFGVPVLYTPYLSHPDPTVERRTGFLTPLFGGSDDLGAFLFLPYYIDISPEQDATITAGGTTDAGFLLRGEYRRRFRDGSLVLDGSVNRSDRLVDEGTANAREDERWRGHVFGTARFDLNEHWRAGGRVELVSDDTYLETFNISTADVLTSRGYVEGFYGLNYASTELFAFQDLRVDGERQPKILPVANVDWMTEPGDLLGGQGFVQGNLVNLIQNPEQTRRVTAEGGWRRTLYSDFGMATSILASVRGDGYFVSDLTAADDETVIDESALSGRLYPLGDVTARYPLVRTSGAWQQLIEPVLSFTAATAVGNEDDIPNNDSVSIEFDEINLLSPDRFPGFDLVEEGVRVTYGLRTGLFHEEGSFATVFLGQSYRLDKAPTDFPEGSGLATRPSDLVGRVQLVALPWANIDWRFRFDQETLQPRRQEVSATGGVPQLRLTTTYTFIDPEAGTGLTEPREEILLAASSRVTDYWTASGSFLRDLAEQENRSIGAGVTYQDECFTFSLTWVRDLTEDRDRESGDTVFVTVAFRNLGDPIRIGTTSLF